MVNTLPGFCSNDLWGSNCIREVIITMTNKKKIKPWFEAKMEKKNLRKSKDMRKKK